MSLVQNFFTSIADAGRDLWERRSDDDEDLVKDLRTLCIDLLSQKGEALGTALARELVRAYTALDANAKQAFFRLLRDEFSVDLALLDKAIAAYQADPGSVTAIALSRAAETPRLHLIRALNMAPGGTKAVVAMRSDLLGLLATTPDFEPIDADLRVLLRAWFNRGFLQLERIDWRTPAHILEKLINYENVHAIQGWDDLRRRLDSDRRCFAFSHPALPDEPLIFVEVALVNGLADAIQPLLDADLPRVDPAQADTAIFYSINNCQDGLRGISFGNFLIKQVVAELEAELPNLKTFSTLSPLPGFGHWLSTIRAEAKPENYDLNDEQLAALSSIDQDNWPTESDTEAVKKPLLKLCAHYLLHAKRDGLPLDPVARFHLGNGARLERINWLGDVSPKGLQQAAGLLVNYRYDLKKIVEYHEAYQNNGKISCARSVQKLLSA